MQFKLKTETIELMALLKITGMAGTGGQAGIIITNSEVKVNGEVELRKRAKLKAGDIVEHAGQKILLI
ncbi:MAG: RNA-binding S4 domain-containing protein [Chitinophagales bacterium]